MFHCSTKNHPTLPFIPHYIPLIFHFPRFPSESQIFEADLHVQLATAGDDVFAALLGGADHQGVRLGPRSAKRAKNGARDGDGWAVLFLGAPKPNGFHDHYPVFKWL